MKTMRYILLAAITVSIFHLALFANDGSKIPIIIPPSPEAASLGMYGNYPVGLYTGLPNISIPIYQIKVRDISVPVSISYHASGIRVNQESSSVGLGWALNAGGVVTRTIINKNDFKVQSHYFDESIPDLYFESDKINLTSYVQYGCDFTYLDENGQEQVIDLSDHVTRDYWYQHEFEPDQFSYNFNGTSGTFILNRSGEVINEGKENIKIYFTDTEYSQINIETPDGFKYMFDELETYSSNSEPVPVKTAWYLKQINSPLGESVTFHYKSDNSYSRPAGSIYLQRTISGDEDGCPLPPEINKITESKLYKNVYLDYIDWKHGRLKFLLCLTFSFRTFTQN
jgi:hypothetical protein